MAMPAGPPCFGKKAEACAADPNRPSQYKYIPAELLAQHGLPDGACVCKSKHCWRVFGMADDPKPPGRPSALGKRVREDCLTPVFDTSRSFRSKPAVVVKIHSFKDARCSASGPFASPLRVRCVLTIVGRFFHRCSVVDFERPSSDEIVVEARRDPLPVARAKTLEYAVHGKFRMREGGAAFPDTVWFSLFELRATGCSILDLRAAVSAYEESMAMASEEVLGDLSGTEGEDGESEGEGADGAGHVEGEAEEDMDAMPQAYGEEGAEGADGMGEDAPAPMSSPQSCG